MNFFPDLLFGLQAALTVANLFWLAAGVSIGFVVGIFPGLGAAAAIAILLPFTLGLDITSAIILLAAIYYGSQYGGVITSILINTPGDAAAVASAFDGYPLAQQGRAGPALVMQALAGFIGGTLGVIGITLTMPLATMVARSFGPVEYMLVVLLGLLTLVLMVESDKVKGATSTLLGFAIGTVGTDLATGAQRFTFGSPDLVVGIDFVPVVIGMFGVGEVFLCVYNRMHAQHYEVASLDTRSRGFWPTREDHRHSRGAHVRGSVIGFVLGIIPGAGAVIASFISYSVEKAVSKRKELFGKGAIEGLVAPEAANNSATAGAMIPLLTLGIPGSSSTAVLLGGFIMWGLQPGPLLMVQEREFAWGLIGSMYLGNMMLVVLSILAIPVCVRILKVPYRVLMPVILVLCLVGTYSVNASMIEVGITLAAGMIGLVMRLYGYSPAATVVALVLAPLFETATRQTFTISGGDPGILWDRPYARGLTIIIVLILAGAVAKRFWRPAKGEEPSRDMASSDAESG